MHPNKGLRLILAIKRILFYFMKFPSLHALYHIFIYNAIYSIIKLRSDTMEKLIFVTGNKHKLEIAESVLNMYDIEVENIDLDPDEISEKFEELIDFKATKELDASVAKIVEYCITRDEKLLKARSFSDAQRTALYNRQKGICPDCGEHYLKADMDAHHIVF